MATQIIPNLWLGNILDSRNNEFLKNIDVVINCSTNIPFYSKETINLRIKVEDDLEKESIITMYKFLKNAIEFIHKHLLDNKAIFVHCYAGKQRSATIICAYIMFYFKLSYQESTELLKSKRLIVFTPLPNFDSALKLFEKNMIPK